MWNVNLYHKIRRNSMLKTMRNAEHKIDMISFKSLILGVLLIDFDEIRVETIDSSIFYQNYKKIRNLWFSNKSQWESCRRSDISLFLIEFHYSRSDAQRIFKCLFKIVRFITKSMRKHIKQISTWFHWNWTRLLFVLLPHHCFDYKIALFILSELSRFPKQK